MAHAGLSMRRVPPARLDGSEPPGTFATPTRSQCRRPRCDGRNVVITSRRRGSSRGHLSSEEPRLHLRTDLATAAKRLTDTSRKITHERD